MDPIGKPIRQEGKKTNTNKKTQAYILKYFGI
jgi:hypothetical protein